MCFPVSLSFIQCKVFLHTFIVVVFSLPVLLSNGSLLVSHPLDAGSALARMVLRYQRKSSFDASSSGSSSDIISEDALDKCDWTFLPDPLVDNVFPLSDDLDSDGMFSGEKKGFVIPA